MFFRSASRLYLARRQLITAGQARSYSSLKNKVIAISGAGSGIGLATAKHLYPMGVKLSLTDVRKDALDAAIPQITSNSSDANIFSTTTDVSKSAQVDAWIKGTVEKFGGLDGAANLAGVTSKNIGVDSGRISRTEDEDWHFVNDVNLNGVFYAVRAQLRIMEELGKGGAIVNASSTAGIEGNPRHASYSASKHAVIGLTRSAAKEVGNLGIRVNAISPGVIETPMVLNLSEQMTESIEWLKKYRQSLGRGAKPVEIARLIAFLLSEESSFITGAVYVADGGQVC